MSFSAVAMVGTGATVNFVESVKNERDPFPGLLAAGILLWITVGVDSVAPKVGTAVAAAFLLVCLLDNGAGLAGTLQGAVSAQRAAQAPQTPKG